MCTAILYIRVSTDEQAIKGYSMKNQEDRLVQYCEANNIKVLQVIREDHSAKTFNRPEWKNMLKSFNGKKTERPDLILFTRWDRFSRNAGDAYYMIASLKRMYVEVQAIEQILDLSIPENKLVLALYLAVSEVENDRRALNIKRAIHKAKQEGRWMGLAPKGYANKTMESGNKQIVPVEPEAAMIKNIFSKIAEGDISIREMHRIAVKSGFKCSLNNFWCLLRNPVYCGKIKVPDFENDKSCIVPGAHKGLVSEGLFNKVQEKLDGRTKKVIPKSKNAHFPFRGVFICPECSRMLTGSVSKGSKSYYAYYHCYNGCNFRIRGSKIDDQFLKLLKSLNHSEIIINLFRIIIKKRFDSERKDYAVKQHQITRSLEHLFNRSIKVKELLLRGDIDDDDFNVIKSDCETKINSMGNNLQQVALEIIGLQNDIDKEASRLLCMDQLFSKLPFERKVKMIRLMLKDKIVPCDETFQNALNDVANIIIGTKVSCHEKNNENLKAKVYLEYDAESKYFYNELTNDADFNTTKVSSMFWQRFPQIVAFLKDMASLINLQQTDEHQITTGTYK